MRIILRLLGFLFSLGAIAFLIGTAVLGYFYWKYSQDLPDHAQLANVRSCGRKEQGASTITQQVAKNFLVGNEKSYERKIREALIALRMESTFSKDKILELYLNEIFLGTLT